MKKLAELVLGLAIIFTLMIVLVGGALWLDMVGLSYQLVLAAVFVAVGAVLWAGSGLNPIAFWKGPFRPIPDEVTPAMEAGASWITGTLGTGFVVAGIAYGITGHLWLVISVMWVTFVWFLFVRWRYRWTTRNERGRGNGT